MKKTIEILKRNNIKITPQRLEIYNILYRNFKHFTAEEIYERASSKFPTISVGTVYSILELFKKKKIIQEIRIDFQRSVFDIRSESHHHFQCKKCKRIYDVEMHYCESLERGEINGHLIESFQGYFYGICKNCV